MDHGLNISLQVCMSDIITRGSVTPANVSGVELSLGQAKVRVLISNGLLKLLGLSAAVTTCVVTSQPYWPQALARVNQAFADYHQREEETRIAEIRADEHVKIETARTEVARIRADERVRMADRQNERLKARQAFEIEQQRLAIAESSEAAVGADADAPDGPEQVDVLVRCDDTRCERVAQADDRGEGDPVAM
jgi:hypothetical protein